MGRKAKDPVSRTVGGGQSSVFSNFSLSCLFQRMKPAARSEQWRPAALPFEATHIALFTSTPRVEETNTTWLHCQKHILVRMVEVIFDIFLSSFRQFFVLHFFDAACIASP